MFFGTERTEVWKIMKWEFGTERDQPVYDFEYYPDLNLQLYYFKERLISANFINENDEHGCEIYLAGQKIWPFSHKKFFSLFGEEAFVENLAIYDHAELSISAGWEDEVPTLLLAGRGYCAEHIENMRINNVCLS